MSANWEALKLAEKGRTSVTEGIPAALPALALAAKLQRKALAVGMVLPGVADEAARLAEGSADCPPTGTDRPARRRGTDGEGAGAGEAEALGDLLFSSGQRGPAARGRSRDRPAGAGGPSASGPRSRRRG